MPVATPLAGTLAAAARSERLPGTNPRSLGVILNVPDQASASEAIFTAKSSCRRLPKNRSLARKHAAAPKKFPATHQRCCGCLQDGPNHQKCQKSCSEVSEREARFERCIFGPLPPPPRVLSDRLCDDDAAGRAPLARASSNPPKVMLDACVLLYDSCLKHQASHLNNTHLEVVTGSLTDTDIHALTGAA